MKVFVDGLPVYFPYDYMYPEQYAYMHSLKQTLDAGGHCILEMPTGTGKTVTILSFIASYQLQRPEMSKLIYCTRTVGELEKVLEELDRVIKYRDECFEKDKPEIAKEKRGILALGLTTRRNLCLNKRVREMESREEADAACRSLTASWVRSSAIEIDSNHINDNTELCQYYEGYMKDLDVIPPSGIYTLADLMKHGENTTTCPYFVARHCLSFCNVIVMNYQYVLDPKIASLVAKNLAREAIVVFDEAHNIDTVCIDALTINLKQRTLQQALGNTTALRNRIRTLQEEDTERLRTEYRRLVRGMSNQGLLPRNMISEETFANPVIPEDIAAETVPGSIRKATHFVSFLRRLVVHLKEKKMSGRITTQSIPGRYLSSILVDIQSDAKTLRFCSDRLKSLLYTLEVSSVAEFTSLQLVADFATLLGTYGDTNSFAVIFEPVDDRHPSIPDPSITLACLDARLTMTPVVNKYQSVVLTSGTISPLDLYAKMLGFTPVVMKQLSMSLQRRSICPVITSRGSDQTTLSSKYESRKDISVIRNYGSLIIELASVVPDGIVVFFTSYVYMEQVISSWYNMGIISRIFTRKLVFIETPDTIESAVALDRYRLACDTGRGAIFFCVARGKVAEGIDFDRHYGRCVVMIGVPFQYTESRVLRARLEFMREILGVRESDYLSFDAMRQAAQCMGRVIRSKADYGVMVLADKRYARADKKNKLPKWILDLMNEGDIDLDTDECIAAVRAFLKDMAQPVDKESQLGTALLSEEDLKLLAKGHVNGPGWNADSVNRLKRPLENTLPPAPIKA